MKKLMYLLPVAALAMASCTNSDEPVQAPELAKANVDAAALNIFPVVNASTRVTDANNYSDSNLPGSFFLTTSGNFQTNSSTVNDASAAALTDAQVTKSESAWVIGGTTYYWPSKNATSDFTAYTKKPGEVFTASTTDAEQHDLLVAYAEEKSATDYESGVPLEFQHILSQVVFKAVNADKDDITVKVAGIRINNIYSQATYTLADKSAVATWAEQQTTANYIGSTYDGTEVAEEVTELSVA